MSGTPHLGLMVTTEEDNPRFKDWRTKLTGATSDSNMMILDAAVGAAQSWQEEKNSNPFTWGMLKHGFDYDEG
jgi:hypothetical protein